MEIAFLPLPWHSEGLMKHETQGPGLSSGILWHDALSALRWEQRAKRLLLLICCITASYTAGLAQGTSGTSDDTSQQRSISGQVINSVTGSPVSRALVQLNQRAVLTDHEGHFEFKNAASDALASSVNQASLLTLSVEKPGFFGSDGTKRSSETFDTNSTAGNSDSTITLRLYPEAIISGTIQGADGGPVSNGFVQLRKHILVDGRRQWQSISQSRLNAEGEFRFADLSPGDYMVVPQLQMERIFTKSGQERYIPEHYPPASSEEDSPSMHISAGQTLSLQLSPRHERCYLVSGTVLGAQPGQGLNLRAQTSEGEPVSMGANFNSQTGSFQLMLPHGSYEILANLFRRGGGEGTGLYGSAQVTVAGKDVDGISIALQQTITIPIIVDMQQVSSVHRDITINNQPASPLNMIGVQLQPLSSSSFSQQMWSRQDRQGDQTVVSIPNVTPGRYNAIIHTGGPWYVKSVTWGGADLAKEPLNIAPSAGNDPIRIVIQDDVGRVKARGISNGQPAKGYLYLLPAEPSISPMQMISFVNRAQNIGSQTFSFLAPGNYLLLAYDRPQELEYRNPEVLRQLSSVGKSVTVPPDGEVDAEVEVIRTPPGDR